MTTTEQTTAERIRRTINAGLTIIWVDMNDGYTPSRPKAHLVTEVANEIAAEIDGALGRIAQLEREIDGRDARIEEANSELAAIVFAAHMPIDYECGLPSWINQHLYAAYIGARQSPEFLAMIEDGRLTFPNSRTEKRLAVCEAGIRAEHDRADKAEAQLAERDATIRALSKTPLTALLMTEQEANEYSKAVATIERLKATRTVAL